MRSTFLIFIALAVFLSACRTPDPVSATLRLAPIQVPPVRAGEILVMVVGGGPVANNGEHWFPEGSTLATVLDWAGLDSVAPPRSILLVDPAGHAVRHRVGGRPRKELEQVRIRHGIRVVVPWDRCFGLRPNDVTSADGAGPLLRSVGTLRRCIKCLLVRTAPAKLFVVCGGSGSY
jgi:hypothetical protein